MARKRRKARASGLSTTASVLKRHFKGVQVDTLITASREYPVPARVDLQRTVDELMPGFTGAKQCGIHAEFSFETLALGHLLANGHPRVVVGPLQYEELDVGDASPVRCVRRALWFAKDADMPFALFSDQRSATEPLLP